MYVSPQRTEAFWTPEVTEGCELPGECWALNLGPLQQHQGLLTAEPSFLQSQTCAIFNLTVEIKKPGMEGEVVHSGASRR